MSRVVAKLDTAGLDRILRNLSGGKAEQIVREGAMAVQGKAAALAPVDTGALKSSIMASSAGSMTWRVSDGVEYGIYQELGTSRHAAQPFMVPAVEWVRPQWARKWAEVFKP